MKVLFLTRKWPPAVGGMELYSKELVKSMSGLPEVNVQVLALKGRKDGSAPSLLAIFIFVVRAFFFLVCHTRKFDVVHFGDFVLFPLALIDRLLCASHLRCMTVYGLDLTFSRKTGTLPYIYRKFVNFCVMRKSAIDSYLAISRFTGTLAEELGLGPVFVVPLGISMPTDSPVPDLRPACASHEIPFVLYLGRVVMRKGAFWFAENVLPRFNGSIRFLVAGRFYSSEERELLSSFPNVEILGQVSDKEAFTLRRKALAIVMPNIPVDGSADVEGFGLAALEAPAAGAVLIASRLEGIEDAVIDGETGLLVEPGNIDAWEEAIRDLQSWNEARRSAFISHAQRVLRDRYDWAIVARNTVKIYELCIERKYKVVH